MNQKVVLITQRVLFAFIAVVFMLVAITTFQKIVGENESVAIRPPTTSPIVSTTTTTTTTTTQPPAVVTTTLALPTTTGVLVGSCTMPTPAEDGGRLVRLYFTCGSQPFPATNTSVVRRVEATNRSFTATLTELTKGPTEPEASSGFRSFFNENTYGAFDAVFLNKGRATVEFSRPVLDRTLTESEAAFFIATVNTSVFQFKTVDSVEYRISGDCNEFWEPLGSRCVIVTRENWETQVRDWRSANG